MTARRFSHFRQGRCQQEHMMVLAIVIVVCLAAIRVLSPEQPADARPLWDRVLTSFLGLVQCFGLVVIISFVLASVEVMKQTVARYQSRRVETKLAQLEPILRDARPHATPQNLTRVLRELRETYGIRTPVIAFTVVTRGNVRDELESLGAVVLNKPILPSELKAKIDEILAA